MRDLLMAVGALGFLAIVALATLGNMASIPTAGQIINTIAALLGM